MPATIVLVIDGLPASLPGPYGNTTVETPGLNRLAAESQLFDFCFVESPRLQESCSILWQDLIQEGSILVSDCAEVLTLGATESFDSVIDATEPPKSELASDISKTQTAHFFANAIEALQTLDADGLCWLHHGGLTKQWDAPWEIRCSFADEEDPDPPKLIERPVARFEAKDVDPDILLGYQHSAYAQLVVIDQLLGIFLDQLQQNGVLDQVNLVLVSPRGYPLGEHGIVGSFDNLYNETIHVPLMIRRALSETNEPRFGSRHGGIVQLEQVNRMIAGLLDGGFHSLPFCDVAESSVDELKSLHQEKWKLIHRGSEESAELYSKPDDRWDKNDVSRRCADVVEQLLSAGTGNR